MRSGNFNGSYADFIQQRQAFIRHKLAELKRALAVEVEAQERARKKNLANNVFNVAAARPDTPPSQLRKDLEAAIAELELQLSQGLSQEQTRALLSGADFHEIARLDVEALQSVSPAQELQRLHEEHVDALTEASTGHKSARNMGDFIVLTKEQAELIQERQQSVNGGSKGSA